VNFVMVSYIHTF